MNRPVQKSISALKMPSIPRPRNPASMVLAGFAAAIFLGTGLLMLPISSETGDATSLVTALFTATSAICVTGLVVVDTGSYWSGFGEVVLMTLIQIGGLGIMTLASLLGLLVARRMGLRMQLVAQAETKTLKLGESKRVVLGVLRMSLAIEAVTSLALAARFHWGYDESVGDALYSGVFHGISAYNNAGFALYPDSLSRYVSDPWVIVPITIAFVLGGLGFPVLIEVARSIRRTKTFDHRRNSWTLHTKITLITYAALAAFGVVAITAVEWTNPDTLGAMSTPGRLLAGIFQGLSPRTAGFNSIDTGAMHPSALLITDGLMFIGGGSAGTAGGIKVTTFALLAFVIAAEVRGEPSVHVMGRKIGAQVQRQAVTVVLLSVAAVIGGTVAIMLMTPFDLDDVLFETVSAFGTVGLSTGITADLPDVGQIALVLLMFIGRLGPITLASALALRERGRRYELPEERPIVG